MHRKWTKETVLSKAKEFKTKTEWCHSDQYTYMLAKKRGWFADAVANMPKRVSGIGVGLKRSPEARERMRQAKLGTTQSSEHKAAKSVGAKKSWAVGGARRKTAESIVNSLLQP